MRTKRKWTTKKEKGKVPFSVHSRNWQLNHNVLILLKKKRRKKKVIDTVLIAFAKLTASPWRSSLVGSIGLVYLNWDALIMSFSRGVQCSDSSFAFVTFCHPLKTLSWKKIKKNWFFQVFVKREKKASWKLSRTRRKRRGKERKRKVKRNKVLNKRKRKRWRATDLKNLTSSPTSASL